MQTSMKRWGDDGAIYQLGCPQAMLRLLPSRFVLSM